MTDEPRVWIRKRKCAGGKFTYHLRWIDPAGGGWRSRRIGTDSKRAMCEKVKLEADLAAGSHRDIRKVTWDAFRAEYVEGLAGKRHRVEADRALRDFADAFPMTPKDVTYGILRAYVVKLRDKGLAAATINKIFRYLRSAFHEAIERGYMARHPMPRRQWKWEPEGA